MKLSQSNMKLILIGLLFFCFMVAKSQIHVEACGKCEGCFIGYSDSSTLDWLKKVYCKFPYEKFNINELTTEKRLSIIEELLGFKNDSRENCNGINIGQHSQSYKYLGEIKSFSIQVEALYIINYFIFGDFNYSPYPILKDKKGNLTATDGEIVNQAYKCYQKWVLKAKKEGLDNLLDKGKYPLKNSKISWY